MDIPSSGAVFTLGKAYLTDNSQNYFYIKNDPICRIVAGPKQSAVICESGRLFCWGENNYGQLALGGHNNERSNNNNHGNLVKKPTCVRALKTLGLRIKDVSFGNGWAVILTHSNELFFSGKNIFLPETKPAHQCTETFILENEEYSKSSKPFRLTDFDNFLSNNEEAENFVTLHAGNNHFMVSTSFGRLIGWGSNEQYQLGIENIVHIENPIVPQEIQLDGPVKQFVCGPQSTLVLTQTDNLHVTGCLNEFIFQQFTKLQQNLAQTELIVFIHISVTNDIYIVTNANYIYRSREMTKNRVLIFQRFHDYDALEYGPVWKLLRGSSFYTALTRTHRFYTTFSESGHHLKTFREISKFKSLRLLDMDVGDKHVLVFGSLKTAMLPSTYGLAIPHSHFDMAYLSNTAFKQIETVNDDLYMEDNILNTYTANKKEPLQLTEDELEEANNREDENIAINQEEKSEREQSDSGKNEYAETEDVANKAHKLKKQKDIRQKQSDEIHTESEKVNSGKSKDIELDKVQENSAENKDDTIMSLSKSMMLSDKPRNGSSTSHKHQEDQLDFAEENESQDNEALVNKEISSPQSETESISSVPYNSHILPEKNENGKSASDPADKLTIINQNDQLEHKPENIADNAVCIHMLPDENSNESSANDNRQYTPYPVDSISNISPSKGVKTPLRNLSYEAAMTSIKSYNNSKFMDIDDVEQHSEKISLKGINPNISTIMSDDGEERIIVKTSIENKDNSDIRFINDGIDVTEHVEKRFLQKVRKQDDTVCNNTQEEFSKNEKDMKQKNNEAEETELEQSTKILRNIRNKIDNVKDSNDQEMAVNKKNSAKNILDDPIQMEDNTERSVHNVTHSVKTEINEAVSLFAPESYEEDAAILENAFKKNNLLSPREEDERTTASINSDHYSVRTSFDNSNSANNNPFEDQDITDMDLDAAIIERGKLAFQEELRQKNAPGSSLDSQKSTAKPSEINSIMRQWYNDVRKKGRNISCKSDKTTAADVLAPELQQEYARTVANEQQRNIESRICTIL